MMELSECILRRRSGRIYDSKPIPRDRLDAILLAGLLAPSSRNLKSCEFILIDDRERLQALSQAKAAGGAMLSQAANAIVVIGDSSRSDAWIEDCSIAMTQMMLKATELGIANCWVQIRNRTTADGQPAEAVVRRLLEIPEAYSVLAVLSLGIPGNAPEPHSPEEADASRIHQNSFL